jgi:carbon monoxide dehydrogenase subunit G
VKIEGRARIAAPRDEVWNFLDDPQRLAKCLPGCENLEPDGVDRYKMSLKFGIAAITGKFAGSVSLTEKTPPSSMRMQVDGKGAPGFMKGQGRLTLTEAAGGTDVSYEGEAHVGGLIASVGSRLIEASAKKIIQQFFECAQKQLAAGTKP